MKIYVATPFDEKEWNWFGNDFFNCEWDIRNLGLFGRNPFFWLMQALREAINCRDSDIVITHHPYMSFPRNFVFQG